MALYFRCFTPLVVATCLVATGSIFQACQTAEDLDELRSKAEQGNVVAQFNLGVAYANGQGVPQNDMEAVRWYRKAVEFHHAGAQNNLGLMYKNGDGVPQSDTEAVRWWRLAADQGNPEALFSLALMYRNGEGVVQSDVRAYAWGNVAASRSDGQAKENAAKFRDAAAAGLTPEQRAEGQRMALEWDAAHPLRRVSRVTR